MEPYCLADYIYPNAGNFELANEICPLVVKQLSRARFEISDQNQCKLRIIHSDTIIEVYFDSMITIADFNHILYGIPTGEPSLDYFRDYINNYIAHNDCNGNTDIITVLREYQNSQYKSGSNFENQLWFKIYSDTPIENGMRKLYGAVWIDYEKQLSDGNIIYDKQHTNGIWAMPFSVFKDCFNEECNEKYGDKFFAIQPLPDCQYIYDKKELIGDRFRVVFKSTLDNAKCYMPLIEQYNGLLHSVSDQNKLLECDCKQIKTEKEKLFQNNSILAKIINKQKWINRVLLMIILLLMIYIGFRGV